MARYVQFIILILLLPIFLFAQETPAPARPESSAPAKKAEGTEPNSSIPVQSQYSDKFSVKNLDFNKKLELEGKGEILEVCFTIENHIDDAQDLYVFVIASYEVGKPKETSFDRPIPPHKKMQSFVPYPLDLANFDYSEKDGDGKLLKDDQDRDIKMYKKFPKNPKAGIDAATGKPYHLTDKLVVRTQHLSKYRHNYKYFNHAVILVFDKDGNPVFRQQYELSGFRH